MSDERWIVIPRWDDDERGEGFQHYKDRDPKWIKNYRSLLNSDDYRALTLSERGALHGLWLAYAASNRALREDCVALTRRLGQRITRATLDTLNHAGYIEFSASKPLAPLYHDSSLEKEKEREKAVTKNPQSARARDATPGEVFIIQTMIRNGAIRDTIDLDAELHAHGLNGHHADELRTLLNDDGLWNARLNEEPEIPTE